MSDDKKNGPASYILAGALALGVLFVLIWATVYPTFANRLHSDFWPIDRSYIAPNIVAAIVQAVVVVIALSLFYPPFRHALERFFTRHKADLTDHTEKVMKAMHAKMDAQHLERMRQAERHHQEAVTQVERHHRETHEKLDAQHSDHMAALNRRKVAAPAKKAT